MRIDRAEMVGTGAALAFHVALIAALSLSLAHVASVPEPPSMEVELVEDVALTAAAPSQVAEPPPAAQAPEISETAPVEPAPAPVPVLTPPPPRQVAIPTPRAIAKPTPARPTPAKPTAAKPAPAMPAPSRPVPRASRIGADFLKGIADSPSQSNAPARPSAAKFDAVAKANIAQAVARQIQPCAERQRDLGPGANRIRVVLSIRLFLNGRLKGAPTVVRTSGVDEDNAQYEDLVKDQAIASYRECSPLRLPAELYSTPEGGWSNINMTYRVP